MSRHVVITNPPRRAAGAGSSSLPVPGSASTLVRDPGTIRWLLTLLAGIAVAATALAVGTGMSRTARHRQRTHGTAISDLFAVIGSGRTGDDTTAATTADHRPEHAAAASTSDSLETHGVARRAAGASTESQPVRPRRAAPRHAVASQAAADFDQAPVPSDQLEVSDGSDGGADAQDREPDGPAMPRVRRIPTPLAVDPSPVLPATIRRRRTSVGRSAAGITVARPRGHSVAAAADQTALGRDPAARRRSRGPTGRPAVTPLRAPPDDRGS